MSLPKLTALSDGELLERVKLLKGEENRVVAEVVLHLHEIDSRGIYRDAGYSSLFTYCSECLGYSEGAAYRRVRAARCLKTSPEIYQLIAEGKLTLSALSEVSAVMTAENTGEVLSLAQGASKKEAAQIAVQFGAVQKAKQESIRIKKIAQPVAEDLFSARTERSVIKRYSFTFEVTKEVAELYEQAKAMTGPCAIADVFERALREYVEKRNRIPKQHSKRTSPAKLSTETRYVPKAVRRAVFERDQGRCTYVSPNGRRCNEQCCLEIDHILPVAHGGSSKTENLRLVCRAHNQLFAERWFGKEFMEKRREQARC